jgi:Domain of unknown function (DUF4402)
MKKMTQKLFLAAAIMLAVSSSASAQVTKTATATANIVTPISLNKTFDMNFGNVAVSSTAGTVVLPAAAGAPSRTLTGGVTLPTINGTVTAAAFAVGGEPSYTYAITIPSTDLTITNGASNTMIVNAFVCSLGATGTLDGTGAQTLYIGATLNVGASQASGSYVSGTPFSVTVNYN